MLAMEQPAGPPDWADIALLPPSEDARQISALAGGLRAQGWLRPDVSGRVAFSLPVEPEQQIEALRQAQRQGASAFALCPRRRCCRRRRRLRPPFPPPRSRIGPEQGWMMEATTTDWLLDWYRGVLFRLPVCDGVVLDGRRLAVLRHARTAHGAARSSAADRSPAADLDPGAVLQRG